MSDIVSRKALLECLKKEAELCIKEKFNEKKTRFYLGRETMLTDIIRQIESGRFNLPSTESEGEARDSNMEYLRRRNDSLTKRISVYRDENERIQEEIEQLKFGKSEVIPIIPFQTKTFELKAEIERLRQALITERDDAQIWDGIGTVNRINKVLEGSKQCPDCSGEGGITAENFGDVFSFECPTCRGEGSKP